jgi:filamentous hemagglutinin family protein
MRIGAALVAMLAVGASSAYAAQPAATASRLLNTGFINHGTIKLRPNAPPPSGPVPTAIAVDTTLNPMSSGAIAGTPISGQTGDLYTIGTNYGVTAGNNEFFSFSTFNVGTGDTAQFMAASNIQNIVSRVTGGTTTSVDGTIIAPANFWFINPTGIIVTKNAVFDVSGSLALGAADYINFTNGNTVDKFYADPTQPLTLSVGTPSSFGFLPNTQAQGLSITGANYLSNITNNFTTVFAGASGVTLESDAAVDLEYAQVSTAQGGAILIAGSTVSITASNISAPNGTIGIAAVPSLSDLAILPVAQTTDFLFGNVTAPNATGISLVNSFGTLGAITLTNAYVHSDGSAGGGGVYVLGGQIVVGGNLGPGPINLSATGSNGLDASADAGSPSGSSNTTLGVHVYGQSLTLNGNNQIDTVARGAGNSGPIDIQLTGDLTLDGTKDTLVSGAPATTEDFGTALLSQVYCNPSPCSATGNSGNIDIIANNMYLIGPATAPPVLAQGVSGGPGAPFVSTQTNSTGLGGNINITLTGNLIVSGFSWVVPSSGSSTPTTISGGVIDTVSKTSAPAGSIMIAADGVELHNGAQIQTATLGSGAAGDVTISLTGPSGYLTIDSLPPSNLGGSAFNGSGIFSLSEPPPSCSTCAPTMAPAGNVTITDTQPTAGSITISGSRILSDASLNAGVSGYVTITTPGPISITGSTIDSNVASVSSQPPPPPPGTPVPGAVSIASTASSITVDSSTIETTSTGSGNAGPVSLSSGGTLSITNGSTIQTNSTGGANAGAVSIVGSGVLVDNSQVIANFDSPVLLGQTAQPTAGTILIQATGSNTVAAPQSSIGQVEAGVVQISNNSAITSTNAGGFDPNGIGGSILIGAAPPASAGISVPSGAGTSTDAVVISGSMITNSTSAGGSGADLVINGNQSVWIGGNSNISSTTGTLAFLPAQIYILGGTGGVTMQQSSVNADNAFIGCLQASTCYSEPLTAASIAISSTGAVDLVDATISAQTTGVNPAGNVGINGQTVTISGGTITTATVSQGPMSLPSENNGNAGNISITAAGPDSPSGVAALQVYGGATVTSDASQGLGGANAGTITFTASDPHGSVQIGLQGDATQTKISSSAGPNAGLAGTVTVNAGSSITFGAADVETTAGSSSAVGAPGTITLLVNNANPQQTTGTGPITIANSTLNASTSGPQTGGEIDVTGSQVTTSANTQILSQTSGQSQAGDINITGSTVNMTSTQVSVSTNSTGSAGNVSISASGADPQGGSALSISGGSSVTSDANKGLVGANAGLVKLTASNIQGSVQLGLPGDTTQTTLSSSAGSNAGAAGTVTVNAGKSIALGNADIETIADTILPNGVPASITLAADPNTPTQTYAPIPISIANSTLDASTGGPQPGGQINVTGSNITTSNNTRILSQTGGLARAGDINITASTVNMNGTEVSVSTLGTGSAGNVVITATGADPQGGAALSISGGSTVTSETHGETNSTNAGTITLTASNVQGSVQIGLPSDTTQTTVSSSAGEAAGIAGTVTVNAGKSITLANADINTIAGSIFATGPPASITLAVDPNTPTQTYAPIPISIANSTLNASTSGPQPGGEINVTGSQITTSGNTQILSQTSGVSKAGDISIAGTTVKLTGTEVSVSTTSTGSAGNVSIMASGADPQDASALSISGGSSVTSDASKGQASTANAGTITLTAANAQGSVQIGVTGDTAQTTVSTSAGEAAGTAGTLTITGGNGIALGDANVSTTAGGTASSLSTAAPATITLNANNGGASITVANSTLNATTSGPQAAGTIDIEGSQVAINNSALTVSTIAAGNAGNIKIIASGANTSNGDALQVTGGSTVSSDASLGQTVTTNAGTVTLTASTGSVQVGLPTDTSQTKISSSAGASAGAAGTVSVSGQSVTITGAALTTTVASSQSGLTPATVTITAADGPLSIGNSQLSAQTSGGSNAGDITLRGTSVSIDPSTISTSTSSTGNAGAITITAAPGSLTLNAATIESASTLTAADAGAVGVINLTGGSVSFENSLVSATSAGGAGTTTPEGTPPPAISITSTAGASALLIEGSTVTTTAQSANGSNILISPGGSPVTLQNSAILASAVEGNGGNITIGTPTSQAGNTILESSGILAQAGPGNGGAINIDLQRGALFVQDSQSLVSATSASGNNGTVTINSPQTNFNSALATPDVSVAKAPELSSNACRRDKSRSTFVREGRGGIAPSPDGYQTTLPSSQASTAAAVAQPPNAKPASKDARTLVAAVAEQGCD